MEIIGIVSAIIGIVSGVWYFVDKYQARKKVQDKYCLQSITFERTPLFEENSKLFFRKNTVLIGGNGVGKTAVWEWLSALQTIKYIDRWMLPVRDTLPIILSIVLVSDGQHSLRLKITQEELKFNLDGNDVPANPLPINFVFAYDKEFSRKGLDEAEILAKYFDIDKATLQNYAKRVGTSFYISLSHIQFKNEDKKTNVYVGLQGSEKNCRFSLLSGSEKGRVVIELAIAIAHFLSSTMRVVLVIERSSFCLDKDWAQKYVDLIVGKNFNFQTIFTSVNYDDDVNWGGCNIVEFRRTSHNVTISHKSL